MRTAASTLLVSLLLASGAVPAAPQAAGISPQAAGAAPPAAALAGASGPAAATAAQPTGPDLSMPVDKDANWTVGITVFSAEDLSPENAYLASSIPLLLRDEVSGLVRHTIGGEERDARQRLVSARALAEADKAVTSLRREHDAVLFSGSVQTDAAVKVAAERLRLAVARQDFLRSLDTSLITIPVDKPVALAAGAGEGKLLDAPAMAPAEYCQRNGLDLLVGGTVSEVQGYLLVQVWAWDAARASFVISTRNAALREELYGELPSIASELTTVVLGKDWALVAFDPQPPESSLYVDGALVASGASPAIYLDPGAREIRISAPGYDEISRTLTLAPGASVRLDDALSKTRPGTIEVASDPPGATLYVDSLWAGVTPIAIERPGQRSRGVLDLKGYYPGELELGPSTAGSVSLTLTPDTGPRDVRQNKARDGFYTSFAWFAASIPIPLFSYALVFDFAVETQDFIRAGQLTDAVRAQSWSRAFLYSYYGGVALSTGLFAWMVVRIVQYVAAANAGG